MAKNGVSVRVKPELGKSEAGLFWVALPESGLTEEQLSIYPVSQCLCLQGEMSAMSLDVTEPTWEGVLQTLEYSGNRQRAERERARAEQERRNAKLQRDRERVEAILSEVDRAIENPEPSEYLTVVVYPTGYWQWGTGNVGYYGAENVDALNDASSRLRAEAERRTQASKALVQARADALSDESFLAEFGPAEAKQIDRFDRLKEILDALEEKREAEERAEIRRYLEDAPSDVLERFEADVLPEAELKQILADKLFGGIDCTRYEKLIESDLPEHDESCDEPRVKYQSESYDGVMTAEQWSNYKALGEATKPLGLTPELRIHSVYCENCTARTSRLSARVTKRVGSISVARLYRI